MKCHKCGATIGNTLYEVGKKRLCAVCHLGKEEGSKSKYQKSDNKWTEAKLKNHKDNMKRVHEEIRKMRNGGH